MKRPDEHGGICLGPEKVDDRFLMIGQGGVFTKPSHIRTVLGSCVSVTFHCPKTKAGAIFHALLARHDDFEKGDLDNEFRYVDSAVELSLRQLQQQGVNLNSLQCKVFGGANSLVRDGFCSGRRNVEAAFDVLEKHRLQVLASSVGGERGRKLLFLPHTGDVYVKLLRPGSQA